MDKIRIKMYDKHWCSQYLANYNTVNSTFKFKTKIKGMHLIFLHCISGIGCQQYLIKILDGGMFGIFFHPQRTELNGGGMFYTYAFGCQRLCVHYHFPRKLVNQLRCGWLPWSGNISEQVHSYVLQFQRGSLQYLPLKSGQVEFLELLQRFR